MTQKMKFPNLGAQGVSHPNRGRAYDGKGTEAKAMKRKIPVLSVIKTCSRVQVHLEQCFSLV